MHHDEEYTPIDRVERLINRRLDAQITPDENAELDRLLASDPAARALADDYLRQDQMAAQVLHADATPRVVTITANSWTAWRRGILAAALSAAAVITFAFVPELWRAAAPTSPQLAIQTHGNSPSPIINQQPASHFVDYRPADYSPVQRQRGLQRDLIGIRGDNPNVIYILERNTLSTRLVPITGDF